MNISIVGDIFCDIVASNLTEMPRWGEDTLSAISILPGGSALNTTLHCAKYVSYKGKSNKIVLYSAVGDDPQGKICNDALKDELVVCSNVVKISGGKTGTCLVLSGADRAFVTDRGCINDMRLNWFDVDSIINNGTSHVHCAGLYNCGAMASDWKILLEQAKHRGLTTSINPQFDATGEWLGIYELCPSVDFLFCNQDEAFAITKKSTLPASALELLSRGCKFVVLTSSGKGADVMYLETTRSTDCALSEDDVAIIHQSAYNVEAVIDTTGAGDAFIAGFLAEWMSCSAEIIDRSSFKVNLQSSLLGGCLAGACAVQVVGGSCTLPVEFMRSFAERGYL